MIRENGYFWNGYERRCGDINLRRFDWWCNECEMAIQNKHIEDEGCPRCPGCGCGGDELWDMGEYISQQEEGSGKNTEITQDDEGNWGYD